MTENKINTIILLLIVAFINSFYLFAGVWQRFIDIITLPDDGSFWGGALSVSAFLVTASTTVLAGVFITKIFRNKAVLGRRKWLLFLIILLLLTPVIYYDFGPGRRTCFHDVECIEALYGCCLTCERPEKAVNRSYRYFRRNVNLCFLPHSCLSIDCKAPLFYSKTVCKQGVCQLEPFVLPLLPELERRECHIKIPQTISLQAFEIYVPSMIDSDYSGVRLPKNLCILQYPPGRDGYYIVQFKTVIYKKYKEQIGSLGGAILGYIPENAFIVRMNTATKEKIQDLDIIQWVGIYQPAYKIQPDLLNETGKIDLVVMIFEGEDIRNISDKIESLDGIKLATSKNKVRAKINTSKTSDIAKITGVMWIEKYVAPELAPEQPDLSTGIIQNL